MLTRFVIFPLSLFAVVLSCWTLGSSTLRFLLSRKQTPSVIAISLGLALWGLIGGVLNATGLATKQTLHFLVVLSLLMFLIRHRGNHSRKFNQTWLHIKNSLRTGAVAPVAVAFTNALFIALTITPTAVFNYHDDHHTYLARPLRMLAVGTLGGNPFDDAGLDGLGLQHFLQALTLLHVPLEYVNAFDTLLCQLLGTLLVNELGKALGAGVKTRLLMILFFIIADTQYVNIAAVYSPSVFLLSAAYLVASFREVRDAKKLSIIAGLVGFLCGAAACLKAPQALFVLILLLLGTASLLVCDHSKRGIYLTAAALSGAALMTIPWVLTHRANFICLIGQWLSGHDTAVSWIAEWEKVRGLLSARHSFWGSPPLVYTVLLLTAFAVSLGTMYATRLRRNAVGLVPAVCGVACAMSALIAHIGLSLVFTIQNSIRYSIPTLVPVSVVAMLVAMAPTESLPENRSSWIRLLSEKMAVVLVSVAGIAFAPAFANRIITILAYRTMLSYPFPALHALDCQQSFSNDSRLLVSEIQDATEKNTTILAWISEPFHLDFSRNRILTVTEPGLASPWLELPPQANMCKVKEWLNQYGVRYVMWQYRGFGVKDSTLLVRLLEARMGLYWTMARKNFLMLECMDSLFSVPELVIAANNRILLADLSQADGRCRAGKADFQIAPGKAASGNPSAL